MLKCQKIYYQTIIWKLLIHHPQSCFRIKFGKKMLIELNNFKFFFPLKCNFQEEETIININYDKPGVGNFFRPRAG